LSDGNRFAPCDKLDFTPMSEAEKAGAADEEKLHPKPRVAQQPFIQGFFDRKIDDLLKLYDTTGDISHSGEKGSFRELLLRGVLASILPPHFGLGSGIVVDKWGRQSRQTDIVIFDKRVIPPVVFQEGHGLYPFDAVYRTIEVKSVLRRNHLEEAETAARLLNPHNPFGLKLAAKGNLPNEHGYYPFSALFAFDSEFNVTADAIPTVMRGESASCKLVCVAKQGTVFSGGNELLRASPPQAVRLFTAFLFETLEAAAESRSKFTVITWLF
jgi:hypothetical protein